MKYLLNDEQKQNVRRKDKGTTMEFLVYIHDGTKAPKMRKAISYYLSILPEKHICIFDLNPKSMKCNKANIP